MRPGAEVPIAIPKELSRVKIDAFDTPNFRAICTADFA